MKCGGRGLNMRTSRCANYVHPGEGLRPTPVASATVRQAEVGDAPLPYAVWTFGSLVIEDSQGFQDLLLLQGPAAYEIGQTLSPA